MKRKLPLLLIAAVTGLAQASTTDVSVLQAQQAQTASASAPFAQLVFGGFFTLYDFASPIVPTVTAALPAAASQELALGLAPVDAGVLLPAVSQPDVPLIAGAGADPLLDVAAGALAPVVLPAVDELPSVGGALPAGASPFVPTVLEPSNLPGADQPLVLLVPEPSSVLLAALALGVLGGTTRRNKPAVGGSPWFGPRARHALA